MWAGICMCVCTYVHLFIYVCICSVCVCMSIFTHKNHGFITITDFNAFYRVYFSFPPSFVISFSNGKKAASHVYSMFTDVMDSAVFLKLV